MQGNLSSALSHSISTWNESLTNVIWTIKREENFVQGLKMLEGGLVFKS